ncbi:glycoside hydrolase family 28 protein [Echinicola jeungdonensis]|uniref:Glycoside hydrolase family 28 protein n=1 Tax=Echinicola jeungdonensis TaxID=709343 RepID=A0ABV5J4Z4_9BACT|nr:glycoside hydrolase family 28 protein [Echinicola jeungdonensis]MDN3669527.1 glycoside hydrolase family 28 protein [Echinicola jeungdonensis]
MKIPSGYIIPVFMTVLMGAIGGQANGAVHPKLESWFNIQDFGAIPDDGQLDTEAINQTIITASKSGGGTVYFPAGKYLSFSIELKNNITLHLENGTILEAADPADWGIGYNPPEDNPHDDYQDYGHSHWKNSLIWGIGLKGVHIEGKGLIYGQGLEKWAHNESGMEGNKSIALKNCRNVSIKDISILQGGHFGILATGVDNFTIDNLKIDSNRDGINIDACKNVRISNCTVNTPNDDAIVLKSSYALGYPRFTENLTLTNCQVSGFDLGTMLDGTYQTTQKQAPDKGGVTGRIKMGTESNGGFRNITISNCVFVHCRGLALETVDGGILEDVSISNITMRDIVNAPFFLRLGSRMRGPEGTPVGKLRRVQISNVVVSGADPKYAAMVMGIPDHPVEDIVFDNIRILAKGGAPASQALVEVPELEDGYPDPRNFGEIPAYGFYIRHANGIQLNDINLQFEDDDQRPAIYAEDVEGMRLDNVKMEKTEGVPGMKLKMVQGFQLINSGEGESKEMQVIDDMELP